MQRLSKKLSYISLFSGAGIGCYGFKDQGFECLATNELLEKRIQFQIYNNIASSSERYISGDINEKNNKDKIIKLAGKNLDLLIATPPCQGMSVANHKKNDELKRNSLVVESITLTKKIKPKYFIFENVRSFLKTICTDTDGKLVTIEESINKNLLEIYNIHSKIINLSEFGSNSSRTRTLVIGVRKDLNYVSPIDIFPSYKKSRKLNEIIGKMKSFEKMGDIDNNDIYHNFREYDERMRPWIKNLKEGQSAFENKDKTKIPHRIIDGKVVYNKSSNGDKYRRNFFNKVGPCIHTRNDILASQNTIHPIDDRVFSIREIMKLMTVPDSFKWSEKSNECLNNMTTGEKKLFLKQNELNIRHCLGEGVPTEVFRSIAKNIVDCEEAKNKKSLLRIIEEKKLTNYRNLKNYIKKRNHNFFTQRIVELSNNSRNENKAFYTAPHICFSLVQSLPKYESKAVINILEPSVGSGSFLPYIFEHYRNCKRVNLDLIDIDHKSIEILKLLVKKMDVPKNFKLRFLTEDFLNYKVDHLYDVVIGNPPFGKLSKDYLKSINLHNSGKRSKNSYSYFLEKSMDISNYVSFISPKSILGAPEFNQLRKEIYERDVISIHDHGEKGFDSDVKIETIGITIGRTPSKNDISIVSLIKNNAFKVKKEYIMSQDLPCWILYRDKNFDQTCNKLKLNIFDVFRDRQITKKITKKSGKYRIIKSRNIGNNNIIDIPNYDSYIDNIENLKVKDYLNKRVVLVPNLSYYPRACFLPKKSIVDGSAAILIPKEKVTKKDTAFFATEEFKDFYRIARNYGTRSLNIDSNSVYFFGKLKK